MNFILNAWLCFPQCLIDQAKIAWFTSTRGVYHSDHSHSICFLRPNERLLKLWVKICQTQSCIRILFRLYRIANAPRVWFQTWSLNPIEASKRTRDGTSSVLFEAEMGFRLNVWNQTSGRIGYLNYTKSVVQEYVSFILFVKKFYSLN